MKNDPVSLADWRIDAAEATAPAFAALLEAAERRRRRRAARVMGTFAVLAVAALVGGAAGYGRPRETRDERSARLFEAHVKTLISPESVR